MTIKGAPSGPLSGLTFVVKDSYDVEGCPTSGGMILARKKVQKVAARLKSPSTPLQAVRLGRPLTLYQQSQHQQYHHY